MIKQTVINPVKNNDSNKKNKISNGVNRIKFFIGAGLLFLISYILGINLILPVFLLSLFACLNFLYRDSDLEGRKLLNLIFLFVIICASGYLINKRGWSIFYIPFSAIPMLATILFNELQISLLLTLAAAFTIASISGNNYLGILFSVSGILSSILIFGARKRMAVIRTGFFIGLLQMVSLFVIDRFLIKNPAEYLILMLNGIISSFIVLATLPIFEILFKTVTNISLLELTDTPLLNRLKLETPGTYHHSLVVGNLSEAACETVGANGLLARIGAYYHDVGKIEKAEYFTENQDITQSKHDTLSPTMSKLIIMNHVKGGAELAKKHRLNPRIIDFILQHHGNSLVYYFYRRALENLEEDQEIKEEGFRYPGPKPNTKETAIVLLADSVEAATRAALKDPDRTKIEEVVHKIINNKFIDGQLDECDLTLKDLEKIAAVFIRILSGIHHGRITYPESSRSEPRPS